MAVDNVLLWHVEGTKRINVDIVSETPHEAAEQFREVNGFLPELINDGLSEYIVLGECERCNRAIIEGDHYGYCHVDSTLMCDECVEDSTECVDE